jgi:secreted trypsin-like serine protease
MKLAALVALGMLFVTREAHAITNGETDDGDDAVVALLQSGEAYCTGTLISPEVVVTAAHCVSTPPTQVFFGSTPKSLDSGKTVDVAQVLAHPKFDEDTLSNDIGLVMLKTAAPVKPKARLTSNAALSDEDVALELRIVGFGATSADSFKARKRKGTTEIDSLTNDAFKFLPKPSQTCNGDSGGAAFATVNGKDVLVGVTSSGDQNCQEFGRDMRIDAFESFIDDAVTEYEHRPVNEDPTMGIGGCNAVKSPGKGASSYALALLAFAFLRRRLRRR